MAGGGSSTGASRLSVSIVDSEVSGRYRPHPCMLCYAGHFLLSRLVDAIAGSYLRSTLDHVLRSAEWALKLKCLITFGSRRGRAMPRSPAVDPLGRGTLAALKRFLGMMARSEGMFSASIIPAWKSEVMCLGTHYQLGHWREGDRDGGEVRRGQRETTEQKTPSPRREDSRRG